MNAIKIVFFFVGFAVLFGGMFWLGSLAPSSDEDGEKTSKGGLFARAKDAPKRK